MYSSEKINIIFHHFHSRPSQREVFEVTVTADITADEGITLENLDSIIRTALDAQRIDDLVVRRDKSYSLVPIQGNCISEFFEFSSFQMIQKLSIFLPVCFGFNRL